MKSVWLNIILVLSLSPVSAQVLPDLRFTHLTDKEGLSNNEVNAIVQDADGIIWIGTENGLDRFDGYGFKNFYTDPADPRSIQNNRVKLLTPDTKGNLWGSTTDGIFCFNTGTQRAKVFKSFGHLFHSSYIYLDSTQLPWVTTDQGVYHFSDSVHYSQVSTGTHAMASLVPRQSLIFGGLINDHAGGLWSCWGNALFRLDARSGKVLQTYTCPDSIVIRYLAFDSYNRCWVCTWGKGIYLFDPAVGKWQSFEPSDSRPVIYGAAEWQINGRPLMVFTCSTPCLLFVDEGSGATSLYPFDRDEESVTGPPFVDRQNILWVPTSNGIYFAPPSNHLFNVIGIPELKSDVAKPKFSYVYNMREDSSGYWISKRDYGGLFWYDKHWKLIRDWYGVPYPPAAKAFSPHHIGGEAFDFKRVGHQMFITTEAGISILDLQTLTWSASAPTDVALPRLRTIVVENAQTWWVRSFNHGVFVFNPQTRTFVKHYVNGDTCKHCLSSAINYLIQDPHHNVFATTNAGLYTLNRQTDSFEKIDIVTGSRSLFGLACDSSGMIWVGSENGLFVYNPLTNTIVKTFKEDNRIGIVYRICTDDHQNIWFSSTSGYWCWLRKQDKVVHFDYSLGLPKTDEGIFYKTSDGLVYGGGKDAVVRFYPDLLMHYKMAVKTKIIDATPVGFVTDDGGQKRLTLAPDKNNIQVDFDVINYDLISTNQFFYRLEPGDKDWKQSESGHLSFYNLPPGTYTLSAKGASKLTGTFTNIDSLVITVDPYWYQSVWFMALCVAVAGAVAFYVVRYRIKTIRQEGAFRQKMTEMEMTTLSAQMNPHFVFNSLNSIENFIMQNDKRLASDYLHKFATLIRMILENSRKQVVPLAKDMEAMKLYVDLEKLRFGDKFRYVTDVDESLLKGDYGVPPLLIQPFVENAILHGLAPSDKEDLYLRIAIKWRDDYIHYTIEDNGIGRAASLAYNTRYKMGHKSLGLDISRQRMDIINTQYGTAGTLDIVDLYDDNGSPVGTRVLLTIKIT